MRVSLSSNRNQRLLEVYLVVRCSPLFSSDRSFFRLKFAEAFTGSWLNKYRELAFPSYHGGIVLVGNS
jgi:hypothetical protein